MASNKVPVVGQSDAPFGDHGVDLGNGLEVFVDDGLIDVDPEGLGGLQLRGIGRQIDETDAVGHGERQGVVAGAIENEDDDPVPSRPRLTGEERERVLEEFLVDAGREVPEALAGGRRDEGGDVEPFEAVVAAGDRALAAWRPDPTQDRLQPDAVLVGGEGFDRRAGMALRLLGDGLREFYGMARPSGNGSRSVAEAC